MTAKPYTTHPTPDTTERCTHRFVEGVGKGGTCGLPSDHIIHDPTLTDARFTMLPGINLQHLFAPPAVPPTRARSVAREPWWIAFKAYITSVAPLVNGDDAQTQGAFKAGFEAGRAAKEKP